MIRNSFDIWEEDSYSELAMPIKKAATKYHRQSEKRRIQNRATKVTLKKAMKEIEKLAESKDLNAYEKKLPEVASALDKAVKRNLLHRNTAARRKSMLAKKLKKA